MLLFQLDLVTFYHVFCFLLQELLSRTNLETHKLDLMAENTSLKLKVDTLDKDKREAQEKYTFAQVSRLLYLLLIIYMYTLYLFRQCNFTVCDYHEFNITSKFNQNACSPR